MPAQADAIAVVQARMGSSRVPGKAMLDLAGRPLVGHMIDRVRRVRNVGSIVLATSTDPRNDPMVEFARAEGLEVFRHPGEDDLAGRIAGAIRGLPGDIVLKVGGDCPFIDPAVLQRMVDAARADPAADFVSNRVIWSYPLGLSADVLSRRAIEWADANLIEPQDRELFAVWIRDHPDLFCVVPIVNDEKLDHLAWTVDEPADVEFARWVFSRLHRPGHVFGLAEMLAFLRAEGRL
jgi:spore coat polysaccharide biosynthesis protein SpsF